MKPNLGVMIVIVLLAIPSLTPAESERRDGNFWNQMKSGEKYHTIVGFIEGWKFGGIRSLRGLEIETPCHKRVFDTYSEIPKLISNLTYQQIIDGLDSFYSDYRNRRISIGSAFWMVIEGVSGASQADIDRKTEELRRIDQ